MKTYIDLLEECSDIAETIRAKKLLNYQQRYQGQKPTGELHHNAKLTETQVMEIRKLGASKVKIKDIAKLYSVHRSTVQYVLKRGWKHVGEPSDSKKRERIL